MDELFITAEGSSCGTDNDDYMESDEHSADNNLISDQSESRSRPGVQCVWALMEKTRISETALIQHCRKTKVKEELMLVPVEVVYFLSLILVMDKKTNLPF